MLTGSRETRSIWVETAEAPSFEPLNLNAGTNVCVVGAGIAGMMSAYCLAKAGNAVRVLRAAGRRSGRHSAG